MKDKAIEAPIVSIITAVFNGENYLKDNIDSVINQSYSNVEFIIIDGDSNDNTVEIIKSYHDRISYWISEPDNGIYDAFNKAIDKANGEWLCFIGADDFFWSNKVIEKIIPHLQLATSNNIRYVYGKINLLNPTNKKVIEVLGKPWGDQKHKFLYNMSVAHCGSFHHRDLFLDHGKFDTRFKIAGDYDFLLREFRDISRNAYFVDLEVVGMRNGGISGSLNQRLLMARETKMARKKNNINSVSWDIIFWLLRIKTLLFFEWVFGKDASMKLADYYRALKGKDRRWSNENS